jgi:hypothetical protein
LWRGADINAKSPPKAAWEMVCLPKFEGVGNDALLLKNLNKFFNKADIPWLQLVWESITSMVNCKFILKRAHSGGRTSSSY